MNNSLSIEYALHSVVSLALLPPELSITIKQLAVLMGLAPAYLAKVFTQLSKAGIVRTSVGSKGGIALARPADEISFYDVYVAVNGRHHMFQCANVRALGAGYEPVPGMCEIHSTMWDAEELMFARLRTRKISEAAASVAAKWPEEERAKKLAVVEELLAKTAVRK